MVDIMNNGWKEAFTTMFVLGWVHFIVSSALFFARRRTHPIRGHSFGLVIIAMAPVTAVSLFLSAHYMGLQAPCWLSGVLTFSTGVWSCCASVTRALRIYVFYALADEKLASASVATDLKALDMGSQCHGGLRRKQHWFTDRNFVIFAVVQSLVMSVLTYVPFLLQDDIADEFSTDPESVTCLVHNVVRQFMAAVQGVALVFLLALVWKLRNTYDDYLIKTDLGYSLIYAIPTSVAYFLPKDLFYQEITFFIIAASTHCFIFHVITWKVIVSYRLEWNAPAGRKRRGKRKGHHFHLRFWERDDPRSQARSSTVSHGSEMSAQVSLEDIFRNPTTRKLFTEHLKREWSIENLLFYELAAKYYDMCEEGAFEDNSARMKMALGIYAEYIAESAPSRVNLPSELYDSLETGIEAVLPGFDAKKYLEHSEIDADHSISSINEVPLDFFQAAAVETFRLMERDSLVRFTLSDIWNNYLETNEPTRSDVPASPLSSPRADCKSFVSEQELSKSRRKSFIVASEHEDLVALACYKADSTRADFQPSDHADVVSQLSASDSHSEDVDAGNITATGQEDDSQIVVSISMSSESASCSRHET